jgi:heme/copper-type cytochrome/quinol oxidase subunit 2
MKMTVVVDTPEEYAKWLAEQKTFGGEKNDKKEEVPATPAADTTKTMASIN